MIIPVDEFLSKKLSVEFGIYTDRDYNDFAFDVSNNISLFNQISFIAYNEPERFKKLLEALEGYREYGDSDTFLAIFAYCRYAEKSFEDGLKHISMLLEFNPSNIDAWIDLCFFLSYIQGGYYIHLNMRFHIYHFIQNYQKFDFHSVNKKSISILDRLVGNISRTAAVRSGYDKKFEFDTVYLFMNGACNNNCETCHIPTRLKKYDFEDRLTKNGFITLSKYIFIKARERNIKHFVLKGGEPTLHPDYLKTIKIVSAARPEIMIHVRTNARTFSNSSFVKRHAALNKAKIVFEAGVFSEDSAVHDEITRTQNSHAQTLRGIDNILDEGMKASARIVLCDKNIGILKNTLDFLLEKYAGRDGFGEIGVLLPPPSSDNLDKYYPEGVRRLRDEAAAVLCGYQSEKCAISLLNEALVADS
jgi:sulfatase maturation enzyme AslB (radical SAM superfamily)